MKLRSKLVAAVLLTAAAGVAAGAATGAAPPPCVVKGSTLVAAEGNVVIVRAPLKRSKGMTRRDNILGCWKPTGKKFSMFQEQDHGLDLITRTDYAIVNGRYVGRFSEFEGGVSVSHTAETFDVRTRKKLHDSGTCDKIDRGDTSGPDSAVFLPGGGMAFACNQLQFIDKKGERTLEPKGTDVRGLAVSLVDQLSNPRLYWTVIGSDSSETVKSLKLSAAGTAEG